MKPEWKDAPDSATYLTQNPGGEWYWAIGGDGVPIPLTYGWKNPGGTWRYICDDQPNPNWRETLERRPEMLSECHAGDNPIHTLTLDDTDEPDLIIPKDAAECLSVIMYTQELVDIGYRLEIESDGILGWKE